MIARLGHMLSNWAKRFVPDPLVLAIFLTLLIALFALPKVDYSLSALSQIWLSGSGTKGFWGLLSFAMQMCLILITGHALAETPLLSRLINKLALLPKTTASAAALVSLVAMLFAFLNWGLGLIVGALLAKSVGQNALKQKRPLHYPLIVAAGYAGLLVWHGGFSGSAPLKVTSAKDLTDVLETDLAQRIEPMLLEQTIGSSLNIVVTLLCLIGVPLLFLFMAPKDEQTMENAPDELLAEASTENNTIATQTFAEKLNHSPLVIAVPVLLSAIWLWGWLQSAGLSRLNPNVMNLAMLAAGMALHGSVHAYSAAVQRAVKSCAGIILQYPFYAGIMGIMAGSGLVLDVSAGLATLGPKALSVATFYLAGLVNLFVPSGGGQWAVQGPIIMEAALQSGAKPETILMALAYGDQWTNMIQPFWALPLLGICRIKAGGLLGYTALILMISQLFFVLPLIVFA